MVFLTAKYEMAAAGRLRDQSTAGKKNCNIGTIPHRRKKEKGLDERKEKTYEHEQDDISMEDAILRLILNQPTLRREPPAPTAALEKAIV